MKTNPKSIYGVMLEFYGYSHIKVIKISCDSVEVDLALSISNPSVTFPVSPIMDAVTESNNFHK